MFDGEPIQHAWSHPYALTGKVHWCMQQYSSNGLMCLDSQLICWSNLQVSFLVPSQPFAQKVRLSSELHGLHLSFLKKTGSGLKMHSDGTGTTLSGEDACQHSLDGAVYGEVWRVSSVKFDSLPVHGITCSTVSALTSWTSTTNSNATSTTNAQHTISLQRHWHWLKHAHQPSQNIFTNDYKVPFMMFLMDLPC